MFSVRIHGPGRRTGAPVVSFCRIDDRPIRLREPVLDPDAIIVQDTTLLEGVDVFAGLKRDGYLLFLSRVARAKGIDDLVIAYGQMRCRDDVKLVVAGTGPALRHA